ncbi:hypothetical protein B0T14DRAFT_566658 [Immersiella caudata]|uniref:Uncharacterized protein n=1 Tax=Immersiella caudata TaxID=314043 RepID=A0AA40C041_9PEZI|nr:hypothetical protein B0T14DRAFT_566658 [Immersiella caudata]
MTSKAASADIASRVSKLSLETPSGSAGARSSKTQKTKKAPAVADSWEDEDVSSGSKAGSDKDGDSASDDEQDQDRKATRSTGQAGTAAPPPTPMSPTYGSKHPFPPSAASGDASFDSPYGADVGGAGVPEKKRPEKTDAVARRMIASALGVKVPRMTEEQKKYDQAMREKERRRREEDKALQKKKEDEALKAKQAIWED